MPDSQEIVRSIQGAFLLARFNGAGMTYFNISLAGFWRSFFVAVLVAPFHALTLFTVYANSTVDAGRLATVEIVEYVLIWILFPVAMIFVTRILNLSDRYVAYVIAYNWSYIIQVALVLLLTLAVTNAGGQIFTLQILVFSAQVYLIVFLTFVAKAALETTLVVAIGVMALDYVLSRVVQLAGSSLAFAT